MNIRKLASHGLVTLAVLAGVATFTSLDVSPFGPGLASNESLALADEEVMNSCRLMLLSHPRYQRPLSLQQQVVALEASCRDIQKQIEHRHSWLHL